ncbi:hypothetical protein BJV78DRAFT_794450 [Lactifluus subvellereus]|nr:hypothetical protein BJV78DRAFT_794450 [Lactifluus subvellereus]
MRKTAEEFAQKLSPEIDGRALVWMLKSLDGDPKQEQFFAGVLDFCKSVAVADPLGAFKAPNGEKMSEALLGLMHHTLASNLAPDCKQSRIITCMQAMKAGSFPINWPILQRVIYKDWSGLLSSVEFGLFLTAANHSDPNADYHSKCVIAAIIATAKEHDDPWFELVTSQLRPSRPDLGNYLTNGDCVLLANCIDICDRTIQAYEKNKKWAIRAGWRSKCLEIASDLNTQNTPPELQHEFCRLWNQLKRMTENTDRRSRSLSLFILRHIRKVYFTLHQDTCAAPILFSPNTDDYAPVLFDPLSYPRCSIPGHESVVEGAARDPITTSPTSTPPATRSVSYAPPQSASPHPTQAFESRRSPTGSLDVAASDAARGTTAIPANLSISN